MRPDNSNTVKELSMKMKTTTVIMELHMSLRAPVLLLLAMLISYGSCAYAADMCFFAGAPSSDVQYHKIKRVKLGKGTYGSVKDLLVPFSEKAKRLKADAIINYAGSQHFGFWPWRIVRPIVTGVAIKWQQPDTDCHTAGGTTMAEIMENNGLLKAPESPSQPTPDHPQGEGEDKSQQSEPQ
jgi:hypothetical protein